MEKSKRPRTLAKRPSETALIYQGELDYISRCILDSPSIETGGELFGYWTASGAPVVLYAIGPGPRANHETSFFNQDVDYLVTVGNRLISRFGLQHIGEWHSHHSLGLDRPSGHDASTVANGIASQGLGRFLLAIGTCRNGQSSFKPYTFHEYFGTNFVSAYWEIKEGASPFRAVVDADPELAPVLVHPRTEHANALPPRVLPCGQKAEFDSGHWLAKRGNHAVLKKIVDFLVAGDKSAEASVSLADGGDVEVAVQRENGDELVVFPADFPVAPPSLAFTKGGDKGSDKDGEPTEKTAKPTWNATGDLYADFTEYYNQNYLQNCEKEQAC
jgi:hypothetical protein